MLDIMDDIELLHDTGHVAGNEMFEDVVHNPVYSTFRETAILGFFSENLEKL